MINVKIQPIRKLFEDEDTMFRIYGANVIGGDEVELNDYNNISVKGNMPPLIIGKEYEVNIEHEKSSTYKGTYKLINIKSEITVDDGEQKLFFESILTENQVDNIYSFYKESDDVLSLIENDKFEYDKVKGFGEKSFQTLKKKVLSHKNSAKIISFLAKYGLKYQSVKGLISKYENELLLIEELKKNPYILTNVKGVGFKKADSIAIMMGMDRDAPERIIFGVQYSLEQLTSYGSTWVKRKDLINESHKNLEVDVEKIKRFIDNINKYQSKYDVREFKIVEEKITFEDYYKKEKDIADAIVSLQNRRDDSKFFERDRLDRIISNYEKHNDVRLEDEQKQFIHSFNENSVNVLIGGGGTGKTWVLNVLINIITKEFSYTKDISLLAPTGRASKVMESYIGLPASTIHRAIGINPDVEHTTVPLFSDIIIVDESSMCDIITMSKFFSSINNINAKLLFVGDSFQIPSVGVGNFLYDLINSNIVNVVELKKVHRQKDDGILDVATNVRNGQIFLNNTDDGKKYFGKDCMFHMLPDKHDILNGVIHYYKNVLKKYNPEDVCVVTSTNKGDIGTVNINRELQKIANPPSPYLDEVEYGKDKIIFRVGDLVMNKVNRYDVAVVEDLNGEIQLDDDEEIVKVDIFNGDIGKIVVANKEYIIVEFDGVKIKYHRKGEHGFNALMHAWSATTYKVQGSQFPVVISVIDKSMTYQMSANLAYTSFSRASEYMLVLTQARTLNRAMKRFANMERRTFLKDFLTETNTKNNEKDDSNAKPKSVQDLLNES